jgi:hypothetical protein
MVYDNCISNRRSSFISKHAEPITSYNAGEADRPRFKMRKSVDMGHGPWLGVHLQYVPYEGTDGSKKHLLKRYSESTDNKWRARLPTSNK